MDDHGVRLLERACWLQESASTLRRFPRRGIADPECKDKVFDLFEAPEKRSLAGLPLREHAGKTQVVGLTERPCESLKDFERLYDQANVNRSTSATKVRHVTEIVEPDLTDQ